MIVDKLHKTVQQVPENTAVVYDGHKILYAQLGEVVNKLAHGLKEAGINKGDRVALMLPNVPHFIFSYYALLQVGAIVVPINFMLSKEDLDHVLNEAKPKAIIYWEKFRKDLVDFIKNYSHPLLKIVLGEQRAFDSVELTRLISQTEVSRSVEDVSEDDTALIQYTSGMTDVPVGAELTHANLSENINNFVDYFKLTANDVFGAFLPLFLITTQNEILNSAMAVGATIVLHPRLDIISIAKSIDQYGISIMMASPNIYRLLSELDKDVFSGSSMRICLSSQSVLTKEIAEKFEARFGIILLNTYSVTETSGLVAAMHPSFINLNGSLGVALPGVEIQIHDSQGEEMANEEVGEIAIRSKSVLKRYWHRDELTKNRLKNEWFYPGDFGKKNAEGFVTFVDRKANVIEKSGFQIHTNEIEQLLLTHPKIKEVAVISMPHPNHKEDVRACVVLKENETVTEEEIKEFCREHFPVYKCPQEIKFFKELPRTKMGRIFKRKLRQQI